MSDSLVHRRLHHLMEAARCIVRRPENAVRLVRDTQRYGRLGARLRSSSWAQGLAYHGYDAYTAWCQAYEPLDPASRQRMRHITESLRDPPVISVLMSTYNIPTDFITAAIESVRTQIYPHWNLCIADNASTEPEIAPLLKQAAESDPRIKVAFREVNENLSVARNTALTLASGSFVACLDADDLLAPHALFMMARGILAFPDADMFYADEDRIDHLDRRYCPFLKPPWDPEMILCQNYIHQPMVLRKSLLDEIRGFRKGYEGAEDWDCFLRGAETVGADRIQTIPHVLYHWRRFPGSGSMSTAGLERVDLRSKQTIGEHLNRGGSSAEIGTSVKAACLDVQLPIPDPPPEVTLVLHGNDAARNVDRLKSKTDYPRFDVAVTNGPASATSEALNEAGLASDAAVVVFLTQAFDPTQPSWLADLIALLHRPGIGATGPKIVSQDGRIAQSAMVLGGPRVSECSHFGQPEVSLGYEGRLVLLQRCSALGLDGLTTRTEHFRALGGFDVQHLKAPLAAADYCLKLRKSELACAWSYRAVLRDPRTLARVKKDLQAGFPAPSEVSLMHDRWPKECASDLFHNPNLSVTGGSFELASPPRIPSVWRLDDE